MAYVSTNPLFKSLTDEQEAQFRAHAQQHDPPKVTDWAIYHPVCREEWLRRGIGPHADGTTCDACDRGDGHA